jgi:hypothetical protein
MSELQPRCPDCGKPVPVRRLCAACEQDRALEAEQLAVSGMNGRGLYCND